jgi:NADP-dependent 3-hydroxy acid dehydrogenase YdfG
MAASLAGQTAVVTGASSGIGSAIALALAAEGMALHLIGRNRDALDNVAEQTRKTSPWVLSYQADLSLDEDLEKLAVVLKRNCAVLDVLVHCAGIISLAPIESALISDFDQQYKTNVRAPFALTQALLPALRKAHGSVAFINSSAGMATRANISQYAATKHALKALADGLRAEVNQDDVRVISIYPGRTASPQQAAIFRNEGRAYTPELLMQPGDVAQVLIDVLQVNRSAEVTDIHIRPMRKT